MLLDQTQGTEMERLWNLLGELSSQLSHNRQQTEELHRRADELRSQAVHSQTGFTLRRFNIDVDKEEFDSELERLNVSLVMENQALQSENRQLSSLLKDYESTLDAVMSKFRSYAHASQQHHLEITRHYENLLLSMPVTLPEPPQGSDPDSAPPIDPLHLQLSLSHLSSLIRKALRSLQGEDPEDSTSPLLHPIGNVSPFDQLKDSFDSLSISSTTSNTNNTSSRARSTSFSSSTSSSDLSLPSTTPSLAEQSHALLLASHHPQTTRNPPHDPSSGGYISKTATSNPLYIPTTSTSSLVASPPKPGQKEVEKDEAKSRGLGPLDEALMREVEVEALRRENEELKKLLGISEDEVEDDTGGGGGGRGEVSSFVGRKLFEHRSGAEQGEEDEEEDGDEKDEEDEDEGDVFNETVSSSSSGGEKKKEETSSLKVEDVLKI